MTKNASGNHRQTLQDEAQQPCPDWCDQHSDADVGTPDAFRTHYSAGRTVGDVTVRLWRTDMLAEGQPGTVTVLVGDDTELTAGQAAELGALLVEAAKKAGDPS